VFYFDRQHHETTNQTIKTAGKRWQQPVYLGVNCRCTAALRGRTYLGSRMNKQAVSELQYLADNITLQDLQMMHTAGGINSVHQFVQMMIDARIQHLQQQEQAA
jgi:hypothetical protein